MPPPLTESNQGVRLMPHHAHSIDRWDDATGSNLYEHLAGVNDLRLGRGLVKSRLVTRITNVRCSPLCGLKSDIPRGPRSAITGREQVQQGSPYSITSSARARSVGGISRPSARMLMPEGWFFSVSNDTAGWAELVVRLRPLTVSPQLAWSRAVVTSAESSVPCSRRDCRCDVSTRTSFVSSPALA